jgi:hypothetical protein
MLKDIGVDRAEGGVRPILEPVREGGQDLPLEVLCVPITSSTSCHQAIFVDQAIDLSLSSDAVQVEIDRLW